VGRGELGEPTSAGVVVNGQEIEGAQCRRERLRWPRRGARG
jgi:hypothetical protein